MWLVTGITMTWRHVFPTPPPAAAPVAYAGQTASPAAAAAAAAEISGDVAPVRQISLTPLPGRLAYTVTLANGWQFLIDAATAQQVEMTDDLVTGLAQQLTGFTATPTITRITDHSPRYPYGPVPVLQAAFADARQTHVYVVPFSGQSWTNTRGDRLRTLLGSLHTLDALRIVVKSDNARTLLLITAALFTLLTALTGYYLALPNRWQWLTRRTQKEKSAPNDAVSPKTHLTQ